MNKTFKIAYLIITALFLSTGFNQVFASEGFNLSYYQSTNENNDLQSIIGENFSEMPTSKNFGIDNGTYWFRLKIDTNIFTRNTIAYLPTHNIDLMELYTLTDGKLKFISKTGNLVTKNSLALDYKYPAFRINYQDIGNTYYLKVNFPKEANFPLKIICEDEFNENNTNSLIYSSFFYGVSLVVLLVHLFYFFKFRDPYYLFYFGFLIAVLANFTLWDGTLLHMLRPFENHGFFELIIHLIQAICLMIFSIHFLRLKDRLPKFIKIAYSVPIILAIAYLSFYVTNNFTIIAIAEVFGVSSLAVLWVIGIFYWKKDPYAKFYVIGYLVLMPKTLYYFSGFLFGLWPVTGEDVIIKIGSIIDMLVFTYAISFRMKFEESKKKERLLVLEQEIALVKSEVKNQNPYFIFVKENDYTETPLTLKEIEIIEFVYEGLTNPQIAKEMFISVSTVKTHISSIFRKFGVNNRNDLKDLISKEIK